MLAELNFMISEGKVMSNNNVPIQSDFIISDKSDGGAYSELELNTPDFEDFDFTESVYNATIKENSVGRTYLVSDQKMGIFNADPDVSVKYKITDGDPDGFFKVYIRTEIFFCTTNIYLPFH